MAPSGFRPTVENVAMSSLPNYRGNRFPPEVINHAVWLYHRCQSRSQKGPCTGGMVGQR